MVLCKVKRFKNRSELYLSTNSLTKHSQKIQNLHESIENEQEPCRYYINRIILSIITVENMSLNLSFQYKVFIQQWWQRE